MVKTEKNGLDGKDGENGKGIVSIEKTNTEGLIDTYTITYTDGTTSTYEVTNGKNGESGSGGTSTDVQINGSSITSSGTANIVTEGVYDASTNKIATMSDMPDITGKQDALVSGTNIKTINNQSILGSGNINISGGEAISVGNIQFDLVEESE